MTRRSIEERVSDLVVVRHLDGVEVMRAVLAPLSAGALRKLNRNLDLRLLALLPEAQRPDRPIVLSAWLAELSSVAAFTEAEQRVLEEIVIDRLAALRGVRGASSSRSPRRQRVAVQLGLVDALVSTVAGQRGMRWDDAL
jgi:hypothetical protein